MTHNNTTKGNDMNRFDTQLHAEDTSAYSDYVDAQELAAIEAEANEADEADEFDWYDESPAWSNADLGHTVELDHVDEIADYYDNERDLDFYDS